VHSHIGSAIQYRMLNLAGKKAIPANLAQRFILNLIAPGLDQNQLALKSFGLQQARNMVSLPKGQR
jgi:hypothetical protein